MALEDLLLPVQRKMVHRFRNDHLCQQARAGRALFDRLRRFRGRLHSAGAGIFFTHVFDDG
jgi:hypothetical protein